jgi:hypothetical protein
MICHICLQAPKDGNGNSRKIYLVFRDGDLIATVDEYYNNDQEVLKRWPDSIRLMPNETISIAVKEYFKYYKLANKE